MSNDPKDLDPKRLNASKENSEDDNGISSSQRPGSDNPKEFVRIGQADRTTKNERITAFVTRLPPFGLRLVVGVIFIYHGIDLFRSDVSSFLSGVGIPAEMQLPIALAELIPGILLIVGILTRISASLLAIIMLGAIFYVKGVASFSGMMGVEFDLLLLAANLLILVSHPAGISISSRLWRSIPRYLL